MASRQRKVERHRQKRQQKRLSQNRFQLAVKKRWMTDACPIHACYANTNWKRHGVATVMFARSINEAQLILAAFYVDLWGMGLKDAWGRVGITPSEFRELVDKLKEAHRMGPFNVGLARHLVFGGIQRAQELGLRLPPKYHRWTKILGELPSGESLDMSLFGVNGKIRLICNVHDLETRLIGSSVDEFLRRPDVEFEIEMGNDFTLIDEEFEAAEGKRDKFVDGVHQSVRQWCFANQEVPHPLLRNVIEASMDAVQETFPKILPDEHDYNNLDELPQPIQERLVQETVGQLAFDFQEDPVGMEEAMEQFRRFAIANPDFDPELGTCDGA
jgi:hypothetical protein